MNKERVIEIAREAGVEYLIGTVAWPRLEAFAALLRAEFIKEIGEPVFWEITNQGISVGNTFVNKEIAESRMKNLMRSFPNEVRKVEPLYKLPEAE
jgi:hypothetical protein